MSVKSFIQYWDKDLNNSAGAWNMLAVHELVQVEYEDEVYKPSIVKATIQNVSAAGGLPQSNLSHNSGTPLIVTNEGHGLHTGARVTVTSESSGAVEQKVYSVEKIDADSFYLQHYEYDPRTGTKHQGGVSARINGDGSATPTIDYVPVGKYNIETTDVDSPDFHMGQGIVLWHVPETFSRGGPWSHDGASPVVITHTSHPYSDDQIVQMVGDTQGTILDGGYKLANSTTNTYELTHVKSGEAVNGNGTAGQIYTYFDHLSVGFPIFYGTITELSEEYSNQYGKVIVFTAKDHLQYLANVTAKRINNAVAAAGEKIGTDPRMPKMLPDLVYLHGAGSQSRFSEAVAQMITDFEDGDAVIHTDNTNGTSSFSSGSEKFEQSGFVLSADELASTQFAKNISETNFKMLRIMQQLSMQDRHTSTTGSKVGALYGAGAGAVTITSAAHGLAENGLIAVTNDSNTTNVPNGIYRVKNVSTNYFKLHTIDSEAFVQTGSTGTIDWEGVEDGNFGYDFYLDSGMYGQPTTDGYSVAGGASQPLRPHMNYFKRGYRQFRPDATGLNIKLPLTTNEVEDGQTRIMYPDARFTVGDAEVITTVELQATTTSDGTEGFKRNLGHTLEILRIKQIACKDNVAFEDVQTRARFAGRWNGDFHWGRHDGAAAQTGQGVLTGRNDEPMLFTSGGAALAPSITAAATATSVDSRIAAKVLVDGVGGTNLGGYVSGNVPAVSAYAGESELPAYGRTLAGGPGEGASGDERIKDEADDATPHHSPILQSVTNVVDCDLLKSVKNIESEKLFSTDSPTCSTALDKIYDVGHGLDDGAWIKIISGTIVDGDDYWMNYYRVEHVDTSYFHLHRLPTEAYDGIVGTIPTGADIYGSGTRISMGSGDVTAYKRVYNIFNGAARIQYQSINSRSEKSITENFVLVSDRIRKDKPYMSIEVSAVADRYSSDATSNGLTVAPCTVPDSTLYSDTTVETNGLVAASDSLVPARYRRGDRISETRFLFLDDHATPGSRRHIFKNTQAIITESILFDKKRSKSEELNYSMEGSDFNEVRRTAAVMLSRSSRDVVRGQIRIVEYPYIKLTGQSALGTSSTVFRPTQNLLAYGGRPGMLVHKTDGEDGTLVSPVLAENMTDSTVTGTLGGSETWGVSDWYRVYIHLRAGHTVRVEDPRSSIQANMIATRITFREGPGTSSCHLEVIGLKDTATGFPVSPVGKIKAQQIRNSTAQPHTPTSIGKARLRGITFSAGA